MRTANPALNDQIFTKALSQGRSSTLMTLEGTTHRTFLLTLFLMAGAALSWNYSEKALFFVIAGLIGVLVFGLITVFKPTISYMTAPAYAICEGLLLGTISYFAEQSYPGIVIQAVSLTVCILLGLLAAYSSGLIRATENFKLAVFSATAGIGLVYLLSFVLSFAGIQIPYLHEGGPIGIGISLFIVVIAALNLVLDFDFIERGVERRAPKYMEWYAAFGLMVTLVWLYIEVLHLLMKIQGSKRS